LVYVSVGRDRWNPGDYCRDSGRRCCHDPEGIGDVPDGAGGQGLECLREIKVSTSLLVRIAWTIAKVLYDYAKERQAVLTPEERAEWNRDWKKDFWPDE